MPGDESMRTALGTCDGCGEELYPRIVHACPVLGTDVVATPIDPDDESMRTDEEDRMRQDTLDFVIEDGGSIVLVTPMTPEARAWADEHVGSDNGYQPYWPTIVVEANYAGDLIDGIASEGFVL